MYSKNIHYRYALDETVPKSEKVGVTEIYFFILRSWTLILDLQLFRPPPIGGDFVAYSCSYILSHSNELKHIATKMST